MIGSTFSGENHRSFRRELQAAWKEFLRRVKAEERAEELELELDDDAIGSAAQSFRYQHDLITAEETEQWLGARRLTLDDFSGYFVRQYCIALSTRKSSWRMSIFLQHRPDGAKPLNPGW